MIALLSVTAVTYAAFPVQTESTNQTTILNQDDASYIPFARDVIGVLQSLLFVGGLGIHRFVWAIQQTEF